MGVDRSFCQWWARGAELSSEVPELSTCAWEKCQRWENKVVHRAGKDRSFDCFEVTDGFSVILLRNFDFEK